LLGRIRNGRFCVEKGYDSPVRVPDEVLKCVAFIGEVAHTDADGKDSGDLHATGFFVAAPASSPELLGKVTPYFVTAKHVAKDLEDRTIYFLVNKIGGGVASLSSPWCNRALLRGVVYIRDSDDSEAV
jgi:hypothetical protein